MAVVRAVSDETLGEVVGKAGVTGDVVMVRTVSDTIEVFGTALVTVGAGSVEGTAETEWMRVAVVRAMSEAHSFSFEKMVHLIGLF